MKSDLDSIMQLVVDLATVNRNHRLPRLDRPETVIEHSYSVAMLCWYLLDNLEVSLDRLKIFQYALVHDALERHLDEDVNTYASKLEREAKVQYEKAALVELERDFSYFPSIVQIVKDYEAQADDESRFVRTVDKLQAILLGWQDDWWPYRKISVSYKDFHDNGDKILAQAPVCLHRIVREINNLSREGYYDQPD